MEILKKLKTANRVRKEKGWWAIKQSFHLFRYLRREERNYQKWIKVHEINDAERQKIRFETANFAHQPLISVILPVYDVEEKWLRLCIESVLKQLYENWEFCIADDKSPSPHIRKILEEYAMQDARIKIVFRAENGHISTASNSALELATGEFCVLLDHDDELSEDALFQVAKEINNFPETAMIYSDEDMIDERGRQFYPKFKPDFSQDLFYSLNLITHLSAYKTKTLRKIGGFKIGLEGSQDYDLALRFIEQIDEKQIRHIPKILYHWRAIRGSVALSSDEKPYAHERARKALREHFERTKKKAKVERGLAQFHRVRYDLPENLPKVSLILSENPQIEKFLAQTDYENLETVLISQKDAKHLSKAAHFNQAVSESSGEILCFVNKNLRPLSKDWLKELVSFAIQKEIGAVGGKILDKRETILSGGLILGFDGLIGTAFRGFPRETNENLFRAQVINNFSAISVQCLAVRRELFDEIGGFDTENLSDSLFGADFCLKVRERNLRVVFTPYAELIQVEKTCVQTKPNAKESEFFKKIWQNVIEKDPFYNPNLSLEKETFTIKL